MKSFLTFVVLVALALIIPQSACFPRKLPYHREQLISANDGEDTFTPLCIKNTDFL